MNLANNGLDQIEQHAEKVKNVNLMILIQVLREVRETRALLEQGNNAKNRGDARG